MIWDILQQTSFNDYFSESSLPNLTPQKLLLDQNIITEFKNLNPQLIEYVQGHYDEFMGRLIEYTIKMPLESDSEDRVRKLPYVSSEVLAIDSQTVYKAFFDYEKDYFKELVGLFDSQAKNNQILCGYFVKIIQNLYKCQKKKTAQKIHTFRQVFYQNLNNQAVATVFTLFLVLLETQQGFMLNQRKQVVQKLIQNLVNGDEQVKTVCKNVLVDVISKFQTFSSGDELLGEILNSELLVKLFNIKDSPATDELLIGYMTKALQKICTSGQQKKSLFQIPQTHKEGIKLYITAKKEFLKSQSSPNNSFKNQTRTQVYRLDKKIIKLLTLMKLAMQNSIIGFLAQDDIIVLFSILSTHSSNDIIKVKIFDVFALIYTKKDTISQEIFAKYFYDKAIQFFVQNKKMYGHFLYQLWKIINKRIVKESLQGDQKQKWIELLKYFDQLDNYEKQAQKVVDRYSNLTKVTKLVVDEEDTASIVPKSSNQDPKNNEIKPEIQKGQAQSIEAAYPPKKNHNESKFQNNVQKTQQPQKKNTVDAFSFDFFASNVPTQTKTQNTVQSKPNADPFAAFDFFAPKTTKPAQTKPQEKKKTDFSDFSSFF